MLVDRNAAAASFARGMEGFGKHLLAKQPALLPNHHALQKSRGHNRRVRLVLVHSGSNIACPRRVRERPNHLKGVDQAVLPQELFVVFVCPAAAAAVVVVVVDLAFCCFFLLMQFLLAGG